VYLLSRTLSEVSQFPLQKALGFWNESSKNISLDRRIIQAGRGLRKSSSSKHGQLSLETRLLEALLPHWVWRYPRMQKLSRQPAPLLNHLHSENVLSHPAWHMLISVRVCCPFSSHHEVPGSIFSIASLHALADCCLAASKLITCSPYYRAPECHHSHTLTANRHQTPASAAPRLSPATHPFPFCEKPTWNPPTAYNSAHEHCHMLLLPVIPLKQVKTMHSQ